MLSLSAKFQASGPLGWAGRFRLRPGRSLLSILAVLLGQLTLLAAAAQCAGAPYGAGYLRLEAPWEKAVPVAAWYPTSSPEEDWTAGLLDMRSARNAPIAPGRFPVIVLSHGSGGSELGHRNWAQHLARNGFIVVAPRHLGDSFDQPEGRGSDVQLVGRPWQAVAALDAVLSDPRLKESSDPKRIGAMGFSAGGYTTLVLAGAVPDFSLWALYCKEHPDDRGFCDPDVTLPRITRPGWKPPRDERVKAAVVFAPLGIVFDSAGLAGVRGPVRVYSASDDRVTVSAHNADAVSRMLPGRVEREQVPGGHFVFVPPCPPELTKSRPDVCQDVEGVDRKAIHERIGEELVEFFNRSLPE